MAKHFFVPMTILVLSLAAASCYLVTTSPAPSRPPLAKELIFYDWVDDKIETVFRAFTQKYGVKITYLVYETQEEAINNMRAGQAYDVVVMDSQFIPKLISERLLAEINYQNIPNFKNISANFRDLAYDPHNQHSIPYTWGTTGMLVRSDLITEPIMGWADLWNKDYAKRVVVWESTPRYTLGLALKSLGYSANSENPAELEAALRRLVELKRSAIWLDQELSSVPLLAEGRAIMAVGWAEDLWLAQARHESIVYVSPKEGAILWGDTFVIPANSPNQYTAELFLNFILKPKISAQIINENYYAMANEAAMPFIKPEILNDPVVYPTNEQMKNAELLLPLSPAGEQLHQQIWERLVARPQ